MDIIKDKASLKRLITKIGKTVDSLDNDIHRAACSALHHVKMHKDTYYVTQLAKATAKYTVSEGKAKWDGRSVRGAALRKWFADFGGLSWSTSAYDNDGGYKIKRGEDPAEIDMQAAIATPFYEYTKDEIKEADPLQYAKSLRDRMRLLVKEGKSKSGKTVLRKEDVAAATSLANALQTYLDSLSKDHGEQESQRETVAEIVKEAKEDGTKTVTKKAKQA